VTAFLIPNVTIRPLLTFPVLAFEGSGPFLARPIFVLLVQCVLASHRWGWQVFQAPGVEGVFPDKEQAIDYAQDRARFRKGEIRVLNSSGNVERVIPFDDTNRKL
jgi:hypothetical protein